MATRQTHTGYHTCSCGEQFDTTEELLDHGRDEHRLSVI
jgi:hypothetical protein